MDKTYYLTKDKRLQFGIDTANWDFPLTLNVKCVGNNNRIWTISLYFLCFALVYCVDEDSYGDIFKDDAFKEE